MWSFRSSALMRWYEMSDNGTCDWAAMESAFGGCIVLCTVFRETRKNSPVRHHLSERTIAVIASNPERPPECCNATRPHANGWRLVCRMVWFFQAGPRWILSPRRRCDARHPPDSVDCIAHRTTAPSHHEYCRSFEGLPPCFVPKNPASALLTLALRRIALRLAAEVSVQYSNEESKLFRSER